MLCLYITVIIIIIIIVTIKSNTIFEYCITDPLVVCDQLNGAGRPFGRICNHHIGMSSDFLDSCYDPGPT